MSYIGIHPQLRAYKSSVYIASAGDTELPLIVDVECLVIKNGVVLTPEFDFYINPNTNRISLNVSAEQGDEFHLINLSTFTFSGLATKDELEKKIKEVQSPLFTVMWFPSRDSITGGFVPADGQTELRSMYPGAFSGIESALVPVVTDADWLSTPVKRASYTTGDGSTTFRVPDYNGKSSGGSAAVVLRGDGLNTAPAGTIQGDAIRNITGKCGAIGGTEPKLGTMAGVFSPVNIVNYGSRTTDISGYGRSDGFNFDASLVVPTAPENRMVNTAGVWCIRLAHQIVQQGIITAKGVVDSVSRNANSISTLNDQLNRRNYTPVAASFYDPDSGISSIGTKIKLPVKVTDGNMVTFTVRVYQSYQHFDVQFSGYMYAATDTWYDPKVTLNSGTTSLNVKIGRDDDGTAYVWIGGGSYTGVAVIDVVSGYAYHTDWSKGWSIEKTDATPNVTVSKKLYPPNYEVSGDIALLNGWTNYSSGYETAGVTRVGNLMRLKGLITNATASNTIITTLAPEHRPKSRKLFLCCCNGGFRRVDVRPDGNVEVSITGTGDSAAYNLWLSLEQISYIVE